MKAKNCKTCGSEIWMLGLKPTFNNLEPKKVAIETAPNEQGNIIVNSILEYYSKIKDKEIEKSKQLGMKLYIAHSGRCKKK